jgi:hypothetical protein
LQKLLDERMRFEQLVNRVQSSRITISGAVGRWSVKDALAYILVYEQYIADCMAEIMHAEDYFPCQSYEELADFIHKHGYPDLGSPLLESDRSNEWIIEKYKNIPLEELVAHKNQAFLSIVASIEGLRQEQLDKHNLLERVALTTFEHYQERYEQISAWLEFVR